MAIKKISDSVKLESLNETDTLLVNHDGVIAQTSVSAVMPEEKKPVLFAISGGSPAYLLKNYVSNASFEYATLDEVLEAYFGAGAYYYDLTGGYYDREMTTTPLTKITAFKVSMGNVSVGDGIGVISGATTAALIQKSNAYFA